MGPADDPSLSCPFMATLVDLLHDFPRRGSGGGGDTLAERLDGLEHEARRHAAPGETLAAIRGVRVLLNLAELPPLPPLEKGGAITNVTRRAQSTLQR